MEPRPSILLFGTCDTKLAPLLELRSKIISHGAHVLLLDTGRTPTQHALIDIPHSQFLPSSADLSHLPRDQLITTISTHLTAFLTTLHTAGMITAAISLGGSSGTSLAAAAMRSALPLGFPKLIVTTVASGDVSPYVCDSDIVLFPSLVDIAGRNHILSQILHNAAAAISGMALPPPPTSQPPKKAVAVSMFGVTTPGVTAAQAVLESQGYEVLVLHATGSGGRILERLVREGKVVGVLDITTTELADMLFGGVLSAGPDRLCAAAEMGTPQIVSIGATDCINFGPPHTLPERFQVPERIVVKHNPGVTVVRTSREECRVLGRHIAKVLTRCVKGSRENTEVWCPGRGVSSLSEEGGPFCDFEADAALIEELRRGLEGKEGIVFKHFPQVGINDEKWATTMAERLVEMMER